jgi:hypothetical protein
MTRQTLHRFLILGLGLLLSACSLNPDQPATIPKPFGHGQEGSSRWQIFCLHMPFEPVPKWHLDLLLMDRLLAPELYREGNGIQLWRFHRRSADDGAGHRLRFLVYAPEPVRQRIQTSLQGNSVLAELIAAGWVKNLSSECGSSADSIDIAATSDRSWSPELQRAWPYFAMGVSATLLDLVESERRRFPQQERSLEAWIALYAEIQNHLDELWRVEGQHGFLHHLNALFGYQPIRLQQHSRF